MSPDPELLVIVPSRGRPHAASALAQTFANTCLADTRLIVAIDTDDPTYDTYTSALTGLGNVMVWAEIGPSTMVRTLNAAACNAVNYGRAMQASPFAIGFMGDDHRPRTYGWDAAYLEALHELGTGIVYGDDRIQGERIPTQVAMTSDIIRALGHMAPPALTHLYVDNYWKDLGQLADCIRYLPQVVVEHMHPVAGKAPIDDGYMRVNSPEMYTRDREAYGTYVHNWHLAADAEKVKALR